ncbi:MULTISPECIES: amino acid ABC transporter permease [unclassified Sedimentibacter]|uniref:amino acid ABC transporter permease n=1 Tax=unclassified Sedimentibacter TaxID=2649220 RepID=UPI0027E1761C|nr:amino acid ABC transporter permease [Sedimentibacter sp. MB35-C1]WMJ78925.1 amino acid ABC transporter permease [Sedimentibacter sp. MB35-C1]
MLDEFIINFTKTFIKDARYKLFLTGIKNTILIALFATLMGILIGLIVAVIRYSAKNNKKMYIPDLICRLYVTVIRGTPVVVQLLIMYYAVFVNMDNTIFIAIMTFGINSGAYVAEIARAGIESVDKGQMEAGLSLGLSSNSTMFHIILPQAVKNILPALGNEFIALLKETSVVGFIPVIDLTNAGNLIRSRTYEPFFSLYTVAIAYLVMVLGMGAVQKRLERRLSQSDRN